MINASRQLGQSFQLPNLPQRVASYGWLLVMAWLVTVYLVISYGLRFITSADVKLYVAQPLLWLSVGAMSIWLWRRNSAGASFPRDDWMIVVAALIALFIVAMLILFGILAGFGHSPYARAPHWMTLNLWFILARTAGQELARWYLLLTIGKRRPYISIPLIWAAFTLITIPLGQYDKLTAGDSAFEFAGRFLLPAATEGALATYLVLLGGPLSGFVFRGILIAFQWMSPILPDLTWMLAAFVGVIAPVLGILFAQGLMEEPATDEAADDKALVSPMWVVAAAFIVFLFWFQTGVFGIRPAITTGVSMEPKMHTGDLAVTRDVNPTDVEVGDIIRFRQYGMDVLHRVIEVQQVDGELVFITQGDNNGRPDEPVKAEDIEGRLVAHIPKIGWVPIWAKQVVSSAQ